MPPHLHPRSTATSTLFAGTLLASFVVVAIPHVFPCPRPRTGASADGGMVDIIHDDQGKPIRRIVRRKVDDTATEVDEIGKQVAKGIGKGLGATILEQEAALFREMQAEAAELEKRNAAARECPVPKPRTLFDRVMSFGGPAAVANNSGKLNSKTERG
jgi:hypothetical protein